jgi:PTS system galactitol-specific IIA component
MDIVDTPNENAQGSKYLTPQLTFLDKHYNNSTDFFSSIFLLLKEKGYVPGFFPRCHSCQRKSLSNRVTHAAGGYRAAPYRPPARHSSLYSVTRLSQPLAWQEMGNDDNTLYVQFIVLLGFIDHSSHLTALQNLMDCLADEQVVQTLREIDDVDTFLCTLTSRLQLDKDL